MKGRFSDVPCCNLLCGWTCIDFPSIFILSLTYLYPAFLFFSPFFFQFFLFHLFVSLSCFLSSLLPFLSHLFTFFPSFFFSPSFLFLFLFLSFPSSPLFLSSLIFYTYFFPSSISGWFCKYIKCSCVGSIKSIFLSLVIDLKKYRFLYIFLLMWLPI